MKIANNSKTLAARRKMSVQTTNSKPGLVYQMRRATSATRRHLVAVSTSGLYKNRELLENGGSWTRNVYRTPMANRGRPIEWSSYFRYAAPPSGGFRFRSHYQRLRKSRDNSRTVAAGREMYTEH
jgi:hypothetical protein